MLLGLISELRSNPQICMLPSSMAAYRQLLLANIDARITSEFRGEKEMSFALKATVDAAGKPQMVRDYVGDAEEIKYWIGLTPQDRVINVVKLTGPMTRSGDACSFGSIQIRNKIMRAAKYPQCRGHIIYCNTPGGMASCLPDLRMAVNEAHKCGQQVWMLIDGQCASGGAFTSALCDKVFCTNLEDEIGSIGMYCAFFTLADGAENKITSEVYHECYATRSENKNEWYRAAANGDMKKVEDATNADLDILIANLLADRPTIKEDQCTGKMYKCRDVIGTLVDGQSNLETMANELLADYEAREGAPLDAKDGATVGAGSATDTKCDPDDTKCDPKDDTKCKPKKDCEDEPEDTPMDDPDDPEDPNKPDGPDEDGDSECDPDKNGKCNPDEDTSAVEGGSATAIESTNTPNNMKTFTAIPAAIGEEPMEVLVDGELTLQGGQAEALEAVLAAHHSNAEELAAAQTTIAEQQTTIVQLNATIAQMQATIDEHASTIEQLNATIADLNATHATEMDEARIAHEAALAEADSNHTAELALVNDALAAANQRVNDLTSEVETLNAAQGQQPQAGAAPVSNGQQAAQQPKLVVKTRYNRNMSAKELAELYGHKN